MSDLDPDHVEWTRRLFQMLRIGGFWGYPNAGLLFRKKSKTLIVCDDSMPFEDGMPGTPEQWKAYQDKCYREVAEHATAAGFEIRDERSLDTRN